MVLRFLWWISWGQTIIKPCQHDLLKLSQAPANQCMSDSLSMSLPFHLPSCSRTVLPWNLSFLIALENSLLLGPLIWLTPPQPPRLDLNVPYLGKPSWHPEFLEVKNNTLILHSKMAWVVGTRCCAWFLLQAELLVLFFLAVLAFIEHAPININSPLHLWKEKNDCCVHSSLSSSRPLWRESLLSIIFKEPFFSSWTVLQRKLPCFFALPF